MQINPKPVKAKIEMRVSAGESIHQRIPINNSTERVWIVDVKLKPFPDGKNFNWFQGGKDMTIQPGETGYSEIFFAPKWMDRAEA